MLKWTNFTLSTMLLLLLSASMQAQNSQSLAYKPQTRQVIASASGNSVRFSSLGEMIQLRLQVIDSSGDVLFDSNFKSGNVIDWSASDSSGLQLADGSYLCIITVKDSQGQTTKTHAIASLHDQILGLKQSDSSLLTAAQAKAAGTSSAEDVSLTILDPGPPSATAVIAHDGNSAHLVSGSGGLSISSGDFFANKLLEHVRLTAEGNLGIGVRDPQARLDVAGLIRTSQGIMFPDGTIQKTAAIDSTHGQTPDQGLSSGSGNSANQKDAKGKRGKNRDGFSPELFVTEDLTINGNIIFTPPSPQFTRDITMQNNNGGLRFFGAPTLTNSPAAAAIQFWGNNSPLPGQLFLDSGAHNSGAVIIRTTGTGGTIAERMRVTATGDVGIGTTIPVSKLHVLGDSNGTAVSGSSPSGVGVLGSSPSGNGVWGSSTSSGVGVLGTSNSGVGVYGLSTSSSALAGFFVGEVHFSGIVGIGTNSPSNTLHVAASFNAGANPTNHVALVENTSTGTSADVLALKINRTDDPETANNYISFFKGGSDVTVGSIQGNGSGGVVLGGPGADYAEWLPRRNPAEQIQPGEIVGLFAGRVTKQTRGATQVMAVSTGPIVAGNDPGEHARREYERVAFIGQVMVRVRGAVQAGDFIVASGLGDGTGVAVSPDCISSEQFEQVVGQAWDSSSDPGLKSVRIAVGLIQRDPTVSRLLEYSRNQTARIAAMESRLTALELRMKRKATRNDTASHRNKTSSGRRF